MADFDETVAGLRAWAATDRPGVQAAVGLLAWHEYWLRRSDFKAACVGSDQGSPYIRWDRAARFAAAGPRCSSSEMTILTTAIGIAGDALGLSGLGYAHKRAVAEAFATVCDVRLEPPIPEVGHSHPDFIPGDPATCHRCALDAPDEGHPMPGATLGRDDD